MKTPVDGTLAPAVPSSTYAGSAAPISSTSSTSRIASVQRRNASQIQRDVRDASGTNLNTNDASGFGLDRPYLGWNTYPTAQEASPPASTSSGSFVSLLTLSGEPQHPKIRVRIRALTGAGTSGEVRLIDRTTGQVIAGPTAVGVASAAEFDLEGALVAPTLSGAGAPMRVDVQARITAGANTIGVLVMHAIGKGSS